MSEKQLLENLKQKIGIHDFNLVSDSQFANIQKMAARKLISKEEMQLLVEMMPNFVQLQQTHLDGLKAVINGTKENQKVALDGIVKALESSSDLLKSIVDKTKSEELLSKIADISLQHAHYEIKVAEIIQEVNQDNNSTWKEISRIASVVILVIGGIFLSTRKDEI